MKKIALHSNLNFVQTFVMSSEDRCGPDQIEWKTDRRANNKSLADRLW